MNPKSGYYFFGYDIISLISHEIQHVIDVRSGFMANDPSLEHRADDFSIKHWSYQKVSKKRIDEINKHKSQ